MITTTMDYDMTECWLQRYPFTNVERRKYCVSDKKWYVNDDFYGYYSSVFMTKMRLMVKVAFWCCHMLSSLVFYFMTLYVICGRVVASVHFARQFSTILWSIIPFLQVAKRKWQFETDHGNWPLKLFVSVFTLKITLF